MFVCMHVCMNIHVFRVAAKNAGGRSYSVPEDEVCMHVYMYVCMYS